jgi:DNA-binding transcriptional MerR regulator
VVDHGLTIEALAQRAATKTSTIRLYQSRGLLPPPQISGRVGYYSPAHLARLRVIARLQERGYSLNAIKELLDGWTRGSSLGDLLGLEEELAAGSPEAAEITGDDFAALFPDGTIDPEVARRAIALGLVSFDEETGAVHVPSRAFLTLGRELVRRGVPPAVSLDEYERLATDARRIADRFVALFERYVVEPADPVDPARLTAEIRQFRALATLAVRELVAGALDEAAAEAVARRGVELVTGARDKASANEEATANNEASASDSG